MEAFIPFLLLGVSFLIILWSCCSSINGEEAVAKIIGLGIIWVFFGWVIVGTSVTVKTVEWTEYRNVVKANENVVFMEKAPQKYDTVTDASTVRYFKNGDVAEYRIHAGLNTYGGFTNTVETVIVPQ